MIKGADLSPRPVYLLVGLIVRAKARTYLRCNGKSVKQILAG